MKKKILSALLAALLLSTSFTACSESKTETNTDAPTSSEVVSAEPAAEEIAEEELSDLELRQRISDDLPEMKWDGADFRVYTSNATWADYEGEIIAEELTGDACNDAVYNRNIKIEERFDIKMSVSSDSTPWNMPQTLAHAGTDDYHLVAFYDYQANVPISAKALLNWTEAPYQDLDKPWHNKLANDGATINNRLYAICSDLSYTSMTFTHTIFANLDLLNQYGHMREDLYNLVLEGKWTIDQFISMIGEMYQDTNGNGKSDTADLYGFGYSVWNPADVWFTAFGGQITTINESGKLDVTFMSEKTVSMLEKLFSFHFNFPGFISLANQYDEEDYFAGGQLVFAPMRFQAAYIELRDMEDEYTMLPYPKWDEGQAAYYTNADDKFTVFGMPTPSYNSLEFVSMIFEALCAESYKTVYPAYYDQALKGKYSTDRQTADMVDLIMAGRKFDFAFQFGNSLFVMIPYMLRGQIQDNNPNIASAYQKIEKSLTKGLEKKLYPLYGFDD